MDNINNYSNESIERELRIFVSAILRHEKPSNTEEVNKIRHDLKILIDLEAYNYSTDNKIDFVR